MFGGSARCGRRASSVINALAADRDRRALGLPQVADRLSVPLISGPAGAFASLVFAL
jgi:hypothetical protein